MTSRPMNAIALTTITAAATALLMQACGGNDAVAQSVPVGTDFDQIQGVWDSTVTNKDCTSGAVTGTFKALVVLHRGGTAEVDSSTQRSTRSNIYGVWKHGTGPTYTADVTHLRFNPDATLAGSNKIRRTMTLGADGNSFTATLAIQFFDTAGLVTGTACASETSTRVAW